MGSKQQEVHQNHMVSQNREWPSWDREKGTWETQCLCSVIKGERPLLGCTGFLSCQGFDLVHIYDCVCGSNFSSPHLFTLSTVMFLTSFQLLSLISALCQPNTDSWHLYLRFQCLFLCSAPPQRTRYTASVLSLPRLWPWEYLLTELEFSSEDGSGSVQRSVQTPTFTYGEHGCHSCHTTRSWITNDVSRICLHFKSSLLSQVSSVVFNNP